MGLKQKDKRFQPPCLDSYGLNVSSHDPSSGVIVSVKCLFCEKFGREVNGDEEQKRTSNVKYFKSLWRNDNIQKHITEQHELKFAEYKQLIPEGREIFFASNDTTFQPMNASSVSLNVLVDKSIVETIIGRLLIDLDSDEHDLNNAVHALSIFQLQENADEGENVNSKQYLISVGNSLQFSMIIKYIGAGLSF